MTQESARRAVRGPVFLAVLLLLSACRSAPVVHQSAPATPTIKVTPMEPWTAEAIAASEDIERRLDRLISVDYRDKPLGEVLEELGEAMGVDLVVRYGVLELVGIEADSVVQRLGMREVPVRRVLREALAQVSAEQFDDDKPGFVNERGVLIVSTIADLGAFDQTLIYDIRPLIRGPQLRYRVGFDTGKNTDAHRLGDWADAMRGHPLLRPIVVVMYERYIRELRIDLERIELAHAAGGPFRGYDFYHDLDAYGLRSQIVWLIEQQFESEVWDDHAISINEYSGDLVIRASLAEHRRITRFLNLLLANEVRDREAVFNDLQISRILGRAMDAYLAGDLAGSLLEIESALAIDPDHATAVGLHRFVAGRLEQAGRAGE